MLVMVSHGEPRTIWTSMFSSALLNFFTFVGVLAGDWAVHLSEHAVQAPCGSSVTLNCTYDFPDGPPSGLQHRVLSEMWCLNQGFCITPTYVYHSDAIFPEPAYQGRVQYLGTLGSKVCSLSITDLKTTDSGVYVFRFITDHLMSKLPGQKGVTLQVTEGGSVSVTGIVVAVAIALIVIVIIAACVKRRLILKSFQAVLNTDGAL